MFEHLQTNSSVTIALAMVIGLVTQALAHHLRVPGIILLLFVGVCLGPDGAEIIHPSSLGDGLHTLVGFAVAIILFEGGMCLHLERIRKEVSSIRRLITFGAVITAIGGTLSAYYLMPGWSWKTAALFGSLVVVTGPTVVSPLLKRLRVTRPVSTVLEAEGVLIDAIGAIGAVVALEIALQPTGQQLAEGARNVFLGLGLGSLIGLIGGLLLTAVLRVRDLIPEGMEKVFTLTATLAIFQISNHLVHESGIAAVTVAGMVVGNARFHVLRDLHAFKEQLTLMLIGMLFILLAADVRISDVTALGTPGVLVVMALAFVVRPISVFFSTNKSELHWKEKLFISWIGPRGIIAAAVASLFASKLEQANMEGGPELRALVFLVIALSVLWAGLTGGLLAKILKLQKPRDQGWLILGANPLAITMAKTLQTRKQEVVCIDSDSAECAAAEKEGIRVIFGNGLEERTLKRAEMDTRKGAIGLTANEAVNLLFVREARESSKVGNFATLLKTETTGITPDMVYNAGCQLLFGGWRNLDHWCNQIRSEKTQVQWWKWTPSSRRSIPNFFDGNRIGQEYAIPLVHVHGKKVSPVDGKIRLRTHDQVAFLVREDKSDALLSFLNKKQWVPLLLPEASIAPQNIQIEPIEKDGSPPQNASSPGPIQEKSLPDTQEFEPFQELRAEDSEFFPELKKESGETGKKPPGESDAKESLQKTDSSSLTKDRTEGIPQEATESPGPRLENIESGESRESDLLFADLPLFSGISHREKEAEDGEAQDPVETKEP